MFKNKSKKAQGLPLNFIVLAAIAVLILVLVVAFVVGGGGGLLGQLFQSGPTAKETIVNNCRTDCNKLQVISSTTQYTMSSYCSKTYAIDLDGNGKIDNLNKAGNDERSFKCWNSNIGVDCTISFRDMSGTTQTCSRTTDEHGEIKNCNNACEAPVVENATAE